MHVVADTDALVAAGVIAPGQAREIEARSRQTMIALAVNCVLFLGILSATGGLIYWLRDPLSVAIFGAISFAIGVLILSRNSDSLRIFGNAAALIGAGTLSGGAVLELLDTWPEIAAEVITLSGGAILILAAAAHWRLAPRAVFITGSLCLIGLAMHLGGLAYFIERNAVAGLPVSLAQLYAAALMVGIGWLTNVRLVTALAIIPFAQVLDTGAFYFHAIYAFSSPEPTLTILQMVALIALCLWVANRSGERTARHGLVLAVLAFVVANLCALIGSLWGDVVGETAWGPAGVPPGNVTDWDARTEAIAAFRETALVIPEHVFTIAWAIVLVGMAMWSAHRNNRGLFNTSIVFGVIHVYTQLYETFGDEPLAYVIGGLALIPVAWGMWRFDAALRERAVPEGLETGSA
ncbi:hypothetical protein [Amaricoccus macauensis]|uniref:hypothetical protein n=1 Tax=Amaricoccus macauensis TaxID=57001 RepID=UPI003C7D4F44